MSTVVRLSPSSTSPSQKLPPSTIYVSELLRTWETAVLLFLNKQIKDKTLTLYISPFLREIGSLPSDEPRYLQGQLNEFIRFLVFLASLVKKSKEHSSEMLLYFKNIPDTFIISFLHFAGPFNDEFLAGIHQQGEFIESTLDREKGAINITCDTTKSTEFKLPAGTNLLDALNAMQEKINKPPQEKFDGINGTNTDNTYMPYDAPQLKFPDTTKGLDVNKYIEDFNVPDTAKLLTPRAIAVEKTKPKFNKTSEPPSIANFVKWRSALQNPPDNGATTVYFVSHSGTMKSFVNDVIKSSPPPLFGSKFNKVFERAQKTNTWSVFFKESQNGLEFNGFRHAESCDNRYKEKGRLKHLERVAAGEYTNLALWGILSTLTFAIKKVPDLIKATAFTQPGLKICYGMNKESKEFLSDAYDGVNVVCGLKDARLATGNFMVDFGNCGTSQFGTVTMDKDCIKLTSKASNRKVVLYLDIVTSTTRPTGGTDFKIQVRFFNDANSNTYIKNPPKNSSLLSIANFLLDDPFKELLKLDLSPDNFIAQLKLYNENDNFQELRTQTSKLAEAISTFIASDRFKMKLEDDKGIHRDGHRPQNWERTFKIINEDIVTLLADTGLNKPLPQDRRQPRSHPQRQIAVTGGTNKKLRKHKNYKTMRKYIGKGRFRNKTKRNNNI